MGTYVNNNKVALGSQYDLDDAVKEIGDLIGVGARTSGTYAGKRVMADLPAGAGINIWSRNKFILQTSTGPLTDIQRKDKTFGLIPYDYAGVKTYFFYGDSPAKGSTLSAIPNLGSDLPKWTYERSASIHRLRDMDGYNHNAVAPIFITEAGKTIDVELNLQDGNPAYIDLNNAMGLTFKYNSNQLNIGNASGAQNVDILMQEFNFLKRLSDISVGDIFAGKWRFALAILCKASESTYAWLIVSSTKELGNPYTETGTGEAYMSKRIIISRNETAADVIKRARRNYGQEVFPAFPFLAYGLGYNSARGWNWYDAGDDGVVATASTQKAIPLPTAQHLSLTFSTMLIKAKWSFTWGTTGAKAPLYFVISGTTYQATYKNSSQLGVSIPRSVLTSKPSVTIRMTSVLVDKYGNMYDFSVGITSPGTATITNASGSTLSSINSSEEEIAGVNETYTFTATDTTLASTLAGISLGSVQMGIGPTYRNSKTLSGESSTAAKEPMFDNSIPVIFTLT